MTATAKNVGMVDFTTNSTSSRKSGLFSRFMNDLMESRARQVELIIVGELQKFTDSTLEFYGYSNQDIANIRKGNYVPPAAD